MAIVTASMHDAGMDGFPGKIYLFLQGQCIDIGPERYRFARTISAQPTDNTRAAGVRNLHAGNIAQNFGEKRGGFYLVKT